MIISRILSRGGLFFLPRMNIFGHTDGHSKVGGPSKVFVMLCGMGSQATTYL